MSAVEFEMSDISAPVVRSASISKLVDSDSLLFTASLAYLACNKAHFNAAINLSRCSERILLFSLASLR